MDEEAARRSVDRLNQLNMERRRIVKAHFEELCRVDRNKDSLGWWFIARRALRGSRDS